MGFLRWKMCCQPFILFLMMTMCCVVYSDATIRAPQNVNNDTRSLIGFTNGSLEIDCDVNASDSFTWTKDGEELGLGERIVTSREGKLFFTSLHKNDSGQYFCTAGTNQIRGRNVTLRVLEKLRLAAVFGFISSPSQVPVSAYTLPEWMISIACVVVIALVTVIIIISHVRMSKPKREDASKQSNVEMSEVIEESIEVVSANKNVEEGPDAEGCKTSNPGKVRQRKSTSSSPIHDSYFIENECLQERNASTEKREGKEKENKRKGRLCTVEYVKEIPKNIEKLDSESSRISEKRFAVSEVHRSQEKFTKRENYIGRGEKKSAQEQERKLAGSGDEKNLKSENFSMAYPPKTLAVEQMKITDSKPGQALRKIISDPCLMNRPPFIIAHKIIDKNGTGGDSTAQGQSLRRISSEPIHPLTIYNGPVIEGSLKLDKESLKELKWKIQKSTKSPAEIQRHKAVAKKKDGRSKTRFSPAAISFTNEIYGRIEELRAPEDKQKESEIYEEIQVQNEGIDEKRERKKVERGKGSSRKNSNEKNGSKISKHEYEPRKLHFEGDSPKSKASFQKLSSPRVEESYERHKKYFENLSFSILEDLEEFDFDEEPNKVIDGIYQDIEGQPSQLADALDQTTESLYEEIHLSMATCQDEYEVNELK